MCSGVRLTASSTVRCRPLALAADGRRYLENRDTGAILSGSQTDETTFTEL
jgi:hypothetical protein